ncbi:glycyl-radical enzyme activating protein [[Enterobacter] lignolyticus]|uniref:Glycyl-radical enzyme activating protein family n=1 Tax=Enterobacter lignolyticus (strain SCF1) TaxID=701347 RepID=E3G4R2_ENTLS|nr:glycyl-radical enzyme activating protein [[Enterobacter] lignolyticus]ADO50530.1 glycyl-radical enzyme activating protein family [[Enterobacter] lignolyticus SCF1]
MKTGLISRIQRYSTKDGPGIRSTVFMQQCNLRCQWCANPETIRPGINVFWFKERCRQCGTCVQAAHGAITLAAPGEGVNIDRKQCDNLLEMVPLCPYDAYEQVGEAMSSQALAERLLRDKAFYDASQGGVTFSGGEPALQADFVRETAARLRAEGVHVCLDTAGHLRWEKLRPLVEAVDLVSYDFKAFDADIHLSCTGVDNRQILANAKEIAAMGKPILARMVIVPTRNDQPEDIRRRLDFIRSLGNAVQQVDILEYHIYGIGKYQKLGTPYLLNDIPACSREMTEQIKQYAEEIGLKATFGG